MRIDEGLEMNFDGETRSNMNPGTGAVKALCPRRITMQFIRFKNSIILLGFMALILGLAGSAGADFKIQCPAGDTPTDNIKCMHVTASDGFAKMADGKRLYVFGFADQTGKPLATAISDGILGAEQPSPPISLNEDDNFYLTVSNVGMVVRPDLFDPHTVHYHGFPEASGVFDGVPEMSISINQEGSITYFYHNVEPGTYMWHCHVEATEHMQMGMLGSLHVSPAQNQLPDLTDLNGFSHHTGYQYVYNDGDGSTYYDKEYTILLGGYDGAFHDASESVQPLPFANMKDTYPVINGRGYPDTVNNTTPIDNGDGKITQKVDSLIEALPGEMILLRMTNLNVTRAFTMQLSGGLKFKVVGRDARINRGRGVPNGKDLYFDTTAIFVAGGSTHDAIVQIPPAIDLPLGTTTYVLYTTNMNYLSNNQEDFGGLMTEIRVTN
ncbi:MAG: multicopper oxidase domain-containing protein [Anaerolineales bacterium]